MSAHDVERALVSAACDAISQRIARTRAEMDSELAALRQDWSQTAHREIEAAEQRIEQLRASQAAWFADFLDGEATAPAPTYVPAARVGEASAPGAPSPGVSSGHDLARQEPPHAAELTADDIKAMSWPEYSALRTTTGIANGGGRGIFG